MSSDQITIEDDPELRTHLASIKGAAGSIHSTSKFELKADGNGIVATFTFLTGSTRKTWYGKGRALRRGHGEFSSKYAFWDLTGTYLLRVERDTVRLFAGDDQIWFARGKQEGLEGQYQIKFPNPGYRAGSELLLKGDGNVIDATYRWGAQYAINTSPGEVISTKVGHGKFIATYGYFELHGTLRLHVASARAMLFDGDEQIWFGTGDQDGLEGIYEIKFF